MIDINNNDFYNSLQSLKVYDAHTHLVGNKLCASDFWEIVHYFWFLRELQGAGYPLNYDEISENDRIEPFLKAFSKTKSTGMNYAVRRIFSDLYGIEITDRQSVLTACELVKATGKRDDWAKTVADKGKIVTAVVNREEHKNFEGLNNTCVWMPRIDGPLHDAAHRIYDTAKELRVRSAEDEKARIISMLDDYRATGISGVMSTLQSFNTQTFQNTGETLDTFDNCLIFLLRAVCREAEIHGLTVQLFLGMEHTYCSVAVPVNRTDRIVNLYGLFEDYKCRFDLVVASEVNNMDVVQVAQIFTNVYAGGMWWFNFRPSTFTDSMAKRFEALASTKSYLSISDSRCIEWCYGKNALIKKLTTDFLLNKVAEGYVSYPEALDIAMNWLHDTPEALYGKA